MKCNLAKLFWLPISLSVLLLFQNCGKEFELSSSQDLNSALEENPSDLATGRTLLTSGTEPELTATILGSELKIRAPRLYAGAINSFSFRGMEYIDTADHGRQLQSAVSFDGHGECYNPTEAGSRDDHLKKPDVSTSVLLSAYRDRNFLETTTDAGFWLYPTETQYRNPLNPSLGCANRPGDFGTKNTTYRDNYLIHKTVLAGYNGIPNVLLYKVDYTLPRAHSSATFESLTGYMTIPFKKVQIYNTQNGSLEPLGWEPMGEQAYPVVVSTEDSSHAMGIYSLPGYGSNPTYGRFDFSAHGTYKWNTVHRMSNLSKGTYSFTHFVFFGTREEVKTAMNSILCEHPPQNLPFDSSRCKPPNPTPPQQCVPNSKSSCQISNGRGEQICNSQGTGFGVCEAKSCDSGYALSGGACVLVKESQLSIPSVEIFKAYSSGDGSYLYSSNPNEGTAFGYQNQGSAFYLASGQTSVAASAVYRCLKVDGANQVVDRMLSVDSKCEGYKTEGIIGYVMPTRQTQNVCFASICRAVKELYRCLDTKTGKHLSTVNAGDCKGSLTVEGVLGFAW